MGAYPVKAFDIQITEIKIDSLVVHVTGNPRGVCAKLRDTNSPINPQYMNDIDKFQSQTQSNSFGRKWQEKWMIMSVKRIKAVQL